MAFDGTIRIEASLERLELRFNRSKLALWIEEGMLDRGDK
jgi:hypothetical protein